MARRKGRDKDAVDKINPEVPRSSPSLGGVRLRLRGPMKGKTVQLSGVQFTAGEAVVPPNHEGLVKYLGLCYQAMEVRDATEADQDGGGGPVPPVEGGAGGAPPEAGAVDDLDGGDDPPPGKTERGPDGDRPGRTEEVTDGEDEA